MADGQANPQQPLATLPPDVTSLTRAFSPTQFPPAVSQAQTDEDTVMQRVSAIPNREQQIIQGAGLGLSPMISKDNTDAQLVPPSQVAGATQDGYRHATLMRNTKGELHLVGNDEVQDAVNGDWTIAKPTPSPAPYVPKPAPPAMPEHGGIGGWSSYIEGGAPGQISPYHFLNPGETIRAIGTKYALPWLQRNAQQNLEEEQREINKVIGPESATTSLPAQVGYATLAPVHRAAALTSSVAGAMLTDPNAQAAMAAGVVDPGIPLAYFGAQGFQGATGIGTGEKGSVRQAWENPTPENWSKALTDLGMMFGAAEGASPGTIVHPTEVGMRAPLTPEAAGAAPGIGEAPVDTGYGASVGAVGTAISKAAGPVLGRFQRAWDPQALSGTQAATKAFRPRNAKANWQDEIARSLPLMRRSADSMGIDIENITPDQALQTADDAAGEAWAEYKRNHLGPNADVMIDTQPVADAMRATVDNHMREQNPGLAAEIERVAKTFDNRQMPLGEVQSRVSTLNNETRNIEAKYPQDKAAAKIAQQNEYIFAQRDTLRGLMDEKLNSLSGPGAAELRKNYGALRSVQDVIQRRLNVVDRGAREPLAAIMAKAYAAGHIATAVISGHPLGALGGILTMAAERRARALNDPNYLTQLAFQKTKAAAPWSPTTPEGPRAPTIAEQVGARAQQLAGAQQQSIPFPEGPLFGIQQTPAAEPAGPPYRMPASSEPAPPEQGQLPPAPEQRQLPGTAPEQRQLPAQGTAPRVFPATPPFNMPPSIIGPQRPALQPAGLPERQISPTPGFEAPTAPSASAEQDLLQKAAAQGRGPQTGGEPLASRPLGAVRGGAQATLGHLRSMNTTLDEGGPDRAASIHLDENAHEALMDMGVGRGGRWGGINLQADRAQGIAREMRNRADAADRAQEPDIARNFRTLADQINRVATLNYDPNAGHAGVPLIREPESIAHEIETHGGQRAFAGGEGDVRNFTDAANVMSHPAAVKATPALRAAGYPNHPAVLAAEMEAHILDGNFADLGLTREEAVDFMKHSQRVLAEHHGPEVMLDPPRLAQRYLQSIDRFIGGAGGETGATATAEAAQPTGTAGGYGENVPAGETTPGAGGGGNRAPSTAGAEEVGPLAFRSLKEQRAYDQQAEAKRISARKPTSEKAPENPLTSDLRIDTDAIRNAGLADKVANVVRNYPGVQGMLRDMGRGNDTESVLDAFKQHLMNNYLFLHDNYPDEFRNQAVKWYDGANDIETRQWPKLYGTTDMQNGGGMAAISPKLDWNKNIGIQQRLIAAMKQQNDMSFTPKMQTKAKEWMRDDPTTAPLVKQLMGRKLGDLQDPLLKALWIHIHQEAEGEPEYDMYAPDGTKVGTARTQNGKGPEAKLGWTMDGNVAKAVSIFEDPSRENIDRKLGDAHKIRQFYNNKIAPNSPAGDTVSDTHHVAAGLMRPLGMKAEEVGHNFSGPPTSVIHGVNGTYGLYADANRDAAAQRDLKSRQMQSVVWDNARALFPASFKNKANNDTISNIWRDYDNGTKTGDEARQAIVDAAGGWKPPDWATYGRGEPGSRSYPSRNVSTGTATKSRNVPAPTVSRAEAGAQSVVGGRRVNAPATVPAVTGGIPQIGRSGAGRGRAAVASSPVPPQLKRVIRK